MIEWLKDADDDGRINVFFLKTSCLQNEVVMHMDSLTQALSDSAWPMFTIKCMSMDWLFM